jgi:hypothetical protein
MFWLYIVILFNVDMSKLFVLLFSEAFNVQGAKRGHLLEARFLYKDVCSEEFCKFSNMLFCVLINT